MNIPPQPKVYAPRKNPLDCFSNEMFMRRYRLSKPMVEELSEMFRLSGFCSTSSHRGGGLVAAERFCLALRYFVTGGNYSVIGDFQGVSKSTVSRAVHEVVDFFLHYHGMFIQFPRGFVAMEEKERRFYEKYGEKPMCIGAVDGTHVPILTPSEDEIDYLNRKGFHSLNAMIVVDADKRITYVNARFPGSVHDSTVLRRSRLWNYSTLGHLGPFFLLGDSAYPLKTFLLTPFLNAQTPQQHHYNRWHSQARSVVEQTIGLLKQRFRCLNGHGGYLYHSPSDCHGIFTVCVCLHNLCVERGIDLPPGEDELGPAVIGVVPVLQDPPHRVLNEVFGEDARGLRNHYAASLF